MAYYRPIMTTRPHPRPRPVRATRGGGTTRPGLRYAVGDYFGGGGGTINTTIGGGLGEWLGGLIGLPSGLGGALGTTFLAPELPGGAQGAANDSPYIPNIIEAPLEGLLNVGATGRRRRTMNAANISALRRALRRVDSFRNLAKKSGAIPAAKRLPPQRMAKCCK